MPINSNALKTSEADSTIKHQVGAVIISLMQSNNMDESSLAKACNISLASLSRIKNNPESNPTISTLRPIAEFFNITIDQLLGYSPLNKNTAQIKRVPIINNLDVFTWLNNKNTKSPINSWLSCDLPISDHTFAMSYKLDNNSTVLQNCLILVDPKRELKHEDLILIYNKKIKQFFLRLISIDDQNKLFLKPIESGFSDYIALDSCSKNIDLIGVAVESRLQYKIELREQ